MISVIASFAEDTIISPTTDSLSTRKGGPALWITDVFNSLNIPHKLVTGPVPAQVEITVGDGGEKGRIMRDTHISVTQNIKAQYHLISTIRNDFNLSKIDYLDGDIILDIQGYVRALKENLKLTLNMESRFRVMKGTENEVRRVDLKLIEHQKSRILLITKGARGFDMYYKNKLHSFEANPIATSNTIGSGDTLLAAFTAYCHKGFDPNLAAVNAQKYVENFLQKKL